MKRFLSSVALCTSLLLIGLSLFMPSSEAQDNVLPTLLNLPAPPPPNPFFRPSTTERNEDFYNKEKLPADDAPIEDLLDYWSNQSTTYRELGYNPKPSEKSLDRILDEIKKNPEKLTSFLNILPKENNSADFVKNLYDDDVSAKKFGSDWRETVRRWLAYNSKYFSDDLVPRASAATDTGEYVSNQDELLALTRVDWQKARPIVERLYGDSTKPVSKVLAQWALYKHALEENSFGDIERYRDELKKVVEDKSATDGMRDLALDALVKEKDWSGRDDWYLGLLEDETLADLRVNGQSYTGLTTIIYYVPADRLLDKMLELLKSSNVNVRNAAVRNLGLLLDRTKNPELVRALIPWLENPKWAREFSGERRKILTALRNYQMPESVPGLIAMLNEKERREVYLPNANANVPIYQGNRAYSNMNAAVSRTEVDSYPYRSQAIAALEKQRSPLAAAPLRQVLSSVENWERTMVVRAMLASNGFTIAEQIEALEDAAETYRQTERMLSNVNVVSNTAVIEEYEDVELRAPTITMSRANVTVTNTTSYRPQPITAEELRMLLGNQLTNIEEPGDELVKAVIDRIGFHDKRNPQLASALRRIVQNWKGTAVNAMILRDLKNGKTNTSAIVKLLTLRRELREKQINDVTDIRTGTPTALGISACLLEQPTDYDAILDGDNVEAKVAMLGCARLIRAALPIEKAAVNLKSPNKLLALAAERYLESEDSPAARQIVLAAHPNEAKILGARMAFTPDGGGAGGYQTPLPELFGSVDEIFKKFPAYYFYGYSVDDTLEKRLQKEVKENQELLGVYSYDDNFVRIYKDKIVFSWQDDPARYRERNLTADEFDVLKNYLASQRVDELPPFLSACPECQPKELLMLGRAGGRRVFVRAEPLPPFFTELEKIFEEFRRQPGTIHYYLEKELPGLEVLFADENLKAETVWKNGDDFRILIDDLRVRQNNEKDSQEPEITEPVEDYSEDEAPPLQKAEWERVRRENERIARQKQYGSLSWYKFDKIKLLDPAPQPSAVEAIPSFDAFAVQPNEQQWKARSATVEIRADETGLYKIAGGQLTKIRDGHYYKPLVTPNGRWAVAAKFDREEGYVTGLMRVNLTNGKEFKVNLETDYGAAEAVAFLPALNKVLLFTDYSDGEFAAGERSGEFYLLDVETGTVQSLKNEARPLIQQTFRPLQAVAANADSLWTALPDREKNATQFGIYSTKTLVFKPLLTIPQIAFDSMEMWVDEAENKIYFVYEGQLLALPLPKNR